MLKDKKIAIIIPSYKISQYIQQVIAEIPSFCDYIIIIDDKCPENGSVKNSMKNMK